MKHLKTFEGETNYQVGDYVYIPPMYFTDGKARHGKIIESDVDQVPFNILFSNGECMWCSKHQLFRKLFPSEIEQFELNLNVHKYNI